MYHIYVLIFVDNMILYNGIYNSAKIQEYLKKHGSTRDTFPWG